MELNCPTSPSEFLAQPRRGYHHGRLKEALIEAARVLVAQKGPAGFTLAEAAKLVGVTAAAPYRHFTDRNALIAELARRGFAQFADCLQAAWNGGDPDPVTACLRSGPAYLNFVRNEPGVYSAMFHNFALLAEEGPCEDAMRARGILLSMTNAVVRHFGADEGQTPLIAMQIWSLSHGVSMLAISGHLNDPEAVIGAGMKHILEGGIRNRRNEPLAT